MRFTCAVQKQATSHTCSDNDQRWKQFKGTHAEKWQSNIKTALHIEALPPPKKIYTTMTNQKQQQETTPQKKQEKERSWLCCGSSERYHHPAGRGSGERRSRRRWPHPGKTPVSVSVPLNWTGRMRWNCLKHKTHTLIGQSMHSFPGLVNEHSYQ